MKPALFLSNLICLAALVFILSGCATLRPDTDPLLDPKAFVLASQARRLNQHLLTSKGTGWIRIETTSKKDKFKIAWAAAFPDKARITLLMYGHPVETLIATGEKIIFFSHTGEHPKYSHPSKDPNLKNYIKVSIKMSELISILLGRLPVKPFDDAWFSPQDFSLATIFLKQKKGGLAQQSLHFNPTKKIDGIQSTDNSGKLLYEMAITKYNTWNFCEIPAHLKIQDKAGRQLTLEVTTFQPNPVIKASVFQLTPSR